MYTRTICTIAIILIAALLVFKRLHASQSVNVYVAGNAGWVSAGATVAIGDSIKLTATGLVSGASGVPPSDPPDGRGYGPAGPTYLAPGLERYSLVGKIADNPPFQVGSNYRGKSVYAGALYLAYNDEFYPDNSGGYNVTGTIQSAGTYVTQDITTNTNWTVSGNPYFIEQNITVSNGATLTIDPGVIVKLKEFALVVYGQLMAIGTANDSITFTSGQESPQPNDWDRILIQGAGSNNSEFKYCKIQYARVGISFENTESKISHSLIERCHRTGIGVGGGSSLIKSNTIRYVVNEGLGLGSGSPTIIENKVYNCTTGIITDYANSYIADNLIYGNSQYGIDNRNADDAGAVAIIVNNTIDGNGIIGIGPFGANINCDNSSPIIKNNIITNSTNNIGSGYGAGIRATSGGAPIILCNDVWNNAGGNYTVYINGQCSPGQGDISANPLFVDRNNADYHIESFSPCIRAATPIGAPITDIEGIQRGNPPDMGAYENIADGDQSLPVELSVFDAKFTNGSVIISWTTESEFANLGFELFVREPEQNIFALLSSYKYDLSLRGEGTSSIRKAYQYSHRDVKKGGTYAYRLEQIDYSGNRKEYGPIAVSVRVDAKDESSPQGFFLYQNHPNPFNSTTTISFDLPEVSEIRLSLFDLNGKEIKLLTEGEFAAGHHGITLDATDLPTGIFFYRLEQSAPRSLVLAKKLIVMK